MASALATPVGPDALGDAVANPQTDRGAQPRLGGMAPAWRIRFQRRRTLSSSTIARLWCAVEEFKNVIRAFKQLPDLVSMAAGHAVSE